MYREEFEIFKRQVEQSIDLLAEAVSSIQRHILQFADQLEPLVEEREERERMLEQMQANIIKAIEEREAEIDQGVARLDDYRK